MHRQCVLESQMDAQPYEGRNQPDYEQVLLHLKQARQAANLVGDSATATLIEMLQQLCMARAGIHVEPSTSIAIAKDGQSSLASLNVHLFGTFQAFLNGTLINNWRKKSESLFKYLIVYRSVPVHREKLCELFWPDIEPQAARNCLNVTLHALRRNLQLSTMASGTDSLVQFANDHYYLHPRLNIWTDTDAFINYIALSHQALKSGNQTEALAYYEMAVMLYRGHFLENDCYEEWTIQHRERLKTDYLTLLAQESQLYFENKHYTLALERSRKILEHDQCNEEAHCQVMRCLYSLGRRGLALHQYQVLCDVLIRELGVMPMADTIQLYEQIKNGSFHWHPPFKSNLTGL